MSDKNGIKCKYKYIYRHVYNVIITEMSHCITDTT